MGNKIRPNMRETTILGLLINGQKYGREIRDHYQQQTGQKMPLGSLYTTLDRMESKGFVRSIMGKSTPNRKGNRRKYYKLTANGNAALNDLEQLAQSFGMRGGLANA